MSEEHDDAVDSDDLTDSDDEAMPADNRKVPLCEEEKLLRPVGVKLAYKQRWCANDPPPREPYVDPSVITHIRLPFTPTDWWELTTRDGKDYIGPCCGTSGAMQDILCGAYRDSGWIEGRDLLRLGALGEGHDGYEDWKDPLSLDELREKTTLDAWVEHDRWGIIGLIYRALRPKLDVSFIDHKLRKPRPTEKQVFSILRSGLTYLSWRDVFNRNQDTQDQDHANRLLLLARILPAAKLFMKSLTTYQPFDGFALVVGQTDEVLDNHQGMCIFKTVADAQRVIELSEKSRKSLTEDNPNHPDAEPLDVAIRPVRVSVEEGLVFTDKKP